MLFSKRNQLVPASKIIQIRELDAETRNQIWTIFYELFFKKYRRGDYREHVRDAVPHIHSSNLEFFCLIYWSQYLKLPSDTMPDSISDFVKSVRTTVLDGAWNEVFDVMEFTLANMPATFPYRDSTAKDDLMSSWNKVLELENSAYRIVGGLVGEVVADHEIQSIDEAMSQVSGMAGVHIRSALRMLSDRASPDYRNSIKESISAVEFICKKASGVSGRGIEESLKDLAPKIGLHGGLKSALSKMYGYTSDADGIRHAMMDAPDITRDDAQFMLIACSAFVNYIVSKCSDSGISF